MKHTTINYLKKFISFLAAAAVLVTFIPFVSEIFPQLDQSKNYTVYADTPDKDLFYFVNTGSVDVHIYHVRVYRENDQDNPFVLQTSTDGVNWTDFENVGEILDANGNLQSRDYTPGSSDKGYLVTPGALVYFRAKPDETPHGAFSDASHYYFKFAGETGASLKVGGDVTQLYQSGGDGNDTCFSLFYYGKSSDSSTLDKILTDASELDLSKVKMKEQVFKQMFKNCNALTAIPDMSNFNAMAKEACVAMFGLCKQLCNVPKDYLPATELGESCYKSMFSETGIYSAPDLPATVLAQSCYHSMFVNCRNLTAVPDLHSTQLAPYCYYYMFAGDTNLTDFSGVLPAKSVPQSAYNQMFLNCSQLSVLIDIKGTSFGSNAMKEMFKGCNKINDIKVNFTEWPESVTTSWLNGGSATGNLYCPDTLDVKNLTRDVNTIPSGWNVKDIKEHVSYPGNYLNFTAVDGNATVQLQLPKPGDKTVSFVYSKNPDEPLGEWEVLGDTAVSLSNGETVYIAAPSSEVQHLTQNYYTFVITGNVNASGSVMSLLSQSNSPNIQLQSSEFARLFYNCTGLLTSPKLPAVKLGEECYLEMFSGCTNLTEAPQLPALTLVSDCYSHMFKNCDSLTEAPALPSMQLASWCYQGMFQGCDSLQEAPELPAKFLADHCYQEMFRDCISLVTVPAISATSFESSSCNSMFSNCENLNNITVKFTSWPKAADCTKWWLSYVAKEGSFYCPEGLDTSVITRGSTYIPEGWLINGKVPGAASTGYGVSFVDSEVNGKDLRLIINGGNVSDDTDVTIIQHKKDENPESSVKANALDVEKGYFYTLVFSDAGAEHILNVNCKTVDPATTIDTTEMENAYTEYISMKESVKDDTVFMQGSIPSKVVTIAAHRDYSSYIYYSMPADADAVQSYAADVFSHTEGTALIKDQITADKYAYDIAKFNAALTDSFDARIIKLVYNVGESSYSIQLGSTPKYNIVEPSFKIVQGIFDETANFSSIADGAVLEPGCYTVKTTATVKYGEAGISFDLDDIVYVIVPQYEGSELAYLKNCVKAQINNDSKLADAGYSDSLTDYDAIVAACLAAQKGGTGTNPHGGEEDDPQTPKTVDDFVTFTVSGSSINWTAKAGAEIIRVAMLKDANIAAEEQAALSSSFLPIYRSSGDSGSTESLGSGDIWLKVLIQTGSESKIFYKKINVQDACDTPAVVLYSASVGLYARNSGATRVAYVKGTPATLAAAQEAEFNGGANDGAKVYWAPAEKALDKTNFSGEYTFFFITNDSETRIPVSF